MESYAKKDETKRTRFVIVTVLLVVLTSGALLAALYTQEKKWIAALSFGLIAVFSSLIFIGKLNRLIFLLAIFALPVNLDVFLYRKETNFVQLHGLPLTLFDILFLFLCFEWILRIIRKQSIVKFYPWFSIPALIAILFSGISVTVSNDKALSFCAFLLFVKCYLIFLYFVNNLEAEEKVIKAILWTIMLTIIFQSLVGMLQYATGSTLGIEILGESKKSFRQQAVGAFILSRVGGTLGSSNGLAMFLNLFLPVLVCTIFMKNNFKIKFCAFITLMMGLLTEMLTLSRGGWVALAVSLFMASLIIFKHRFGSAVKSIVFTTMFVVILGISIIAVSSDVRERLFEDNYKTAFGRMYMLDVASNMIKENIFWGVGINSYTSEMNKYDRTTENISYNFPYPVHNAFFLFTAENGIFALMAMLFLLSYIFYKSKIFIQFDDRFATLLGAGFFCGILSWFIHSQFEPFSITRNYGVWFSFAMIIALSSKLKEKKENVSLDHS